MITITLQIFFAGIYVSSDNQVIRELRENEKKVMKENSILAENNELLMNEILRMKEELISLKQENIDLKCKAGT